MIMAKWSRSLIRVRYAMEEIAIEDDEYVISVHIMSETWYAKKKWRPLCSVRATSGGVGQSEREPHDGGHQRQGRQR